MTSLPISQHQRNFAYFNQQLSWAQLFEQVINLERTPASCITRQPASTRKRKCLAAKPPFFDHLVKKDCLQWPAKGWSGHWLGCGLSQIPWPVRSIKACDRKLDCNYRPLFCLLAVLWPFSLITVYCYLHFHIFGYWCREMKFGYFSAKWSFCKTRCAVQVNGLLLRHKRYGKSVSYTSTMYRIPKRAARKHTSQMQKVRKTITSKYLFRGTSMDVPQALSVMNDGTRAAVPELDILGRSSG